MPADIIAARKAAQEAKAIAKQKAEHAKRQARDAKALKTTPPRKYVNMPPLTGNAETDSAADLDAVQAGFRERAKDDKSRKALATDTEFWACLCFQTRAQKEAFLSALKLLDLGDKYIDGLDAAQRLGIDLPDERPPYHDTTRIDKTWSGLVD